METKKCPYCGEEIPAKATKCKYCREELPKDDIPMDTSVKYERSLGNQIWIIVMIVVIAIYYVLKLIV